MFLYIVIFSPVYTHLRYCNTINCVRCEAVSVMTEILFSGMLRQVICWNAIIIGDEFAASIFRREDRGRRASETFGKRWSIIRCHLRKQWYCILIVSASEPEISTALRTGTQRLGAILTERNRSDADILSPFETTAVRTATFPTDTIPEVKKGATRRRGKRPRSAAKGCHFQSHSRYLLNNPELRNCCLLYSTDLYATNKRVLRFACVNVFFLLLFLSLRLLPLWSTGLISQFHGHFYRW